MTKYQTTTAMFSSTEVVAAADTVARALSLTVSRYGNRVALRTLRDGYQLTWNELKDRVDRIAQGLASLGVERGSVVALFLVNRLEWHLIDLAAMSLGATSFSIYHTSAPGQVADQLRDSGAGVVATEQALLEPLQAALTSIDAPPATVLVDGDVPEGSHALEDLERLPPTIDLGATIQAVQPEDILTLIYTSGTTGEPKGVEVTHHHIMSAARGVEKLGRFPVGSNVIAWLPTSHSAGRSGGHYFPVVFGATITSCPDPDLIIEHLRDARPTWFFAMPRNFEKFRDELERVIASWPGPLRARADAAICAGLEKVQLEQADEPVPERLRRSVEEADADTFSKLRAHLGLDQLSAVNTGTAPSSRDVLEFFHAIGVPVAEMWGMSELCGAGSCPAPDKVRIGTVGPMLPGGEARLAEDGELEVRGDYVMRGYRGRPEATAEAIDASGWLRSGDVAKIDQDGYITIVGRKKEIIINAAGKNMSPAVIEGTVNSTCTLIGECVIVGDRRRYVTAVLLLDAARGHAWAEAHGLGEVPLHELAQDERMRSAVESELEAANRQLSRVEQIKKFHLVGDDWAAEEGTVTHTLKLKRQAVIDRYAVEIETMYDGGP